MISLKINILQWGDVGMGKSNGGVEGSQVEEKKIWCIPENESPIRSSQRQENEFMRMPRTTHTTPSKWSYRIRSLAYFFLPLAGLAWRDQHIAGFYLVWMHLVPRNILCEELDKGRKEQG